jgi:hypothetical protein
VGIAATEQDQAMARRISRYWVSFARHGDPNAEGPVTWPRHIAGSSMIMDFSNDGPSIARIHSSPAWTSGSAIGPDVERGARRSGKGVRQKVRRQASSGRRIRRLVEHASSRERLPYSHSIVNEPSKLLICNEL